MPGAFRQKPFETGCCCTLGSEHSANVEGLSKMVQVSQDPNDSFWLWRLAAVVTVASDRKPPSWPCVLVLSCWACRVGTVWNAHLQGRASTSVHTSARAASLPATLRIPETLTAHFTATGERWHQDPDCGDIRGRISFFFLPCRNCTVGRLPVASLPLPVHPGKLRHRRRRG